MKPVSRICESSMSVCVSFQDVDEEAGTEDEEKEKEDEKSGPDYNYLLSMPMWFLTKEKKEELCKQRDAKVPVT